MLGRGLLGFPDARRDVGGGMAFFVAPHRHTEFQKQIAGIMHQAKSSLDDALPFAMEPVVYDFRINPHGTLATLESAGDAMMPSRYYACRRRG